MNFAGQSLTIKDSVLMGKKYILIQGILYRFNDIANALARRFCQPVVCETDNDGYPCVAGSSFRASYNGRLFQITTLHQFENTGLGSKPNQPIDGRLQIMIPMA